MDNDQIVNIARQLTPRQKRTLDKLENSPKGVCSFDLRTAAGVMNISDVVCQLRVKGFSIVCELEDHTDQDGRVVQIGRYFLQR